MTTIERERAPACIARPRYTPRWSVDDYWRRHWRRAHALAVGLCRLSGPPPGWRWRLRGQASHRQPPLPWRAKLLRPGLCRVCGRPVFRLGWHVDWADDGGPSSATWHAACVTAFQLWTKPATFFYGGEADHRVPLYRVWRDHRDTPWPDILEFWGPANLQVLSSAEHAAKSAAEARERAEWVGGPGG